MPKINTKNQESLNEDGTRGILLNTLLPAPSQRKTSADRSRQSERRKSNRKRKLGDSLKPVTGGSGSSIRSNLPILPLPQPIATPKVSMNMKPAPQYYVIIPTRAAAPALAPQMSIMYAIQPPPWQASHTSSVLQAPCQPGYPSTNPDVAESASPDEAVGGPPAIKEELLDDADVVLMDEGVKEEELGYDALGEEYNVKEEAFSDCDMDIGDGRVIKEELDFGPTVLLPQHAGPSAPVTQATPQSSVVKPYTLTRLTTPVHLKSKFSSSTSLPSSLKSANEVSCICMSLLVVPPDVAACQHTDSADDETSDKYTENVGDVDEGFPEAADDLNRRTDSLNFLDAQPDCAIQQILSGEDLAFDWSVQPSLFKGRREKFAETPGPTFPMSEVESPMDVFQKFFSEDLITLIVDATNRYAQSLVESNNLAECMKLTKWQPITRDEVWVYLGILMWQGLNPLPVERDHWHSPLPEFGESHLSSLMPFKRFLSLKRCLRFAEDSGLDKNANDDQKDLRKMQPLLDHLNKKFSDLYCPQQEIALDESLLVWKKKLKLEQRISRKATKNGLKCIELCESKTGYLYKCVIYAEKSGSRAPKSGDIESRQATELQDSTANVILDLARPLFHKGHTLVMDPAHNSPLLARALKRNGVDSVGTLRLNSQFIPDSLKVLKTTDMKVGEIATSYTEDLSVLVWRDEDLVALISTYHKHDDGAEIAGDQQKYRPQIVLNYNNALGGVRKKNRMLSAFPIERLKNPFLSNKLVQRLLNITVLNTHIIYNHREKINARNLRLRLVGSIMQRYKPQQLRLETEVQALGSGPHFLERGESSDARCVWCTRRKVSSGTAWRCDTCKVPLCLEVCFKRYHTQFLD